MKFNSRGDVVMGVGGGTVSVNNVGFDQGGGNTGPDWFTDDIVVYHRTATQSLAFYDTRTKQITPAADRGANLIMAGGGVWAAWSKPSGLFTSKGLQLEHAGLAAVGPDGAIAYRPDYERGVGVDVLEPNGDVWTLTTGTGEDVQLLGDRRAIWREGGQIRTFGLPTCVQIVPSIGAPGPRAVFVGGEWWVTYWAGDAIGLAFHPFASTDGYLVHRTPDAYGYAVRAAGAGVLFGWAKGEGEQPGDLVLTPQLLSAARAPLATAPPVVITQPPVINPPDQEPTSLSYKRRSPDYTAEVEKLTKLYPAEWDRANKLKHGGRTDEFVRLAASYLNHFVDPNIGLNGKRGGTEISRDAFAYKNETANGGAEVIDFIVGASHAPAWQDVTLPDVAGRFIQPAPYVADSGAPVSQPSASHPYTRDDDERDECNFIVDGRQCDQPRAAAVHQVTAPPVVVPPVVQPPAAVCTCKAELAALLLRVIAAESSAKEASEAAAAARLTAAEAKDLASLPAELPELEARGSVSFGFFGSKNVRIPVVPKDKP